MKKEIKKIKVSTSGTIGLSVFVADTKIVTPQGMRQGTPQLGIETEENGRKRYVFLSVENAKRLQEVIGTLITNKCEKEG